MKRDLDLIRKLFFRIEEFPYNIKTDFNYEIIIEGFNKEEIDFHLYLMKQANFITGIVQKSVINKRLTVIYETLEITWKGYEFFNSIRDKNVWSKIKSKVTDINLPINIIWELSKIIIKEQLKIDQIR